jgi:outer membrane biosynthesis protein TonB
MQTTPPQIDPEQPNTQPESPQEPETGTAAAPLRIRTNRYGDMAEHELIRLLDTIEDERARGRFRESIYISLFVWLAIAWVLFYGPKYLWHAPQLITPADALHQQEIVQLNAPRLPHRAPAPPPKIDRGTLDKLRAMEPKPLPTPAAPPPPEASQPQPEPPVATSPAQPVPSPALPLPSAPKPAQRSTEPVPDAPQPTSRPDFSTQSASNEMKQAMRGSQTAGSDRSVGISGNSRGAGVQSGAEVLSDTQGVDFNPYLQRILRLIYQQWIPLLPEETRPPLNKQGFTALRITIMPDGNIHVQDGVHNGLVLDSSSHDEALDRAAWGSVTGVGQFPPLPRQFHGPNFEVRIHYLVNIKQTE